MASKPLTIPNVFASEGTGTPNNIPLLDADFSQVANYFNDGSFFSTRGVDTGAANAYVVTLPSGYVPSAYNVGMRLVFNPGNSNTGASTINVNALGTQTILTANGNALTGGEITAGYDCDLVYDGTNFRVMSLAIPQITSVRQRSFSSISNPGFEVDQRQIHQPLTNPATGTFLCDRWSYSKNGTMTVSTQSATGQVQVPGLNFCITNNYLNISLTAQETTLAAGDYLQIIQQIEGPNLRELIAGPASLSLLVSSSVAGLKFSATLADSASTYSICNLCTIPSASTWTLIQIPNIAWTGSGSFPLTPGNIGYSLRIVLAAGSTYTAPSTSVWNSGLFLGAPGMSNFAASPVNSTFSIAFVQHEPGPLSTALIDKPFAGANGSYDESLRYFQKTYPYSTVIGATSAAGTRTTIAYAPATSAFGPVSFFKPMAKAPTVTLYNFNTGAANSVYDNLGVSHGSASAQNIGDSGFPSISFATATTAITSVFLHYTLDTGW